MIKKTNLLILLLISIICIQSTVNAQNSKSGKESYYTKENNPLPKTFVTETSDNEYSIIQYDDNQKYFANFNDSNEMTAKIPLNYGNKQIGAFKYMNGMYYVLLGADNSNIPYTLVIYNDSFSERQRIGIAKPDNKKIAVAFAEERINIELTSNPKTPDKNNLVLINTYAVLDDGSPVFTKILVNTYSTKDTKFESIINDEAYKEYSRNYVIDTKNRAVKYTLHSLNKEMTKIENNTSKIRNYSDVTTKSERVIMKIGGSENDEYTGVSLGNNIDSLVCGNTITHNSEFYKNTQRNAFVSFSSSTNSLTTMLTEYKEGDNVNVGVPTISKTSSGNYFAYWEETKDKKTTVKGAFLNKTGNLMGQTITLAADVKENYEVLHLSNGSKTVLIKFTSEGYKLIVNDKDYRYKSVK